ncbi:MAG: HAMP domain-containing histidine kinase [Lachnospiraceae bacterium]|nr:HAMP domain-containing histidine kinase [Lachnospiraceae bacterium]
MNIVYDTYIFYAGIICTTLIIVIALVNRIRTGNVMKRLDRMLDSAIAGTFNPEEIDESMLSSMEFKFGRYLADVELERKNADFEKNKIKTLISDISHQTKTPISNIMLYSELMQEQDLDETSSGYTRALSAQAQKLNFLIISLIKMSRLETGILALNPKPELLTPLLEEVYTQLAPKASSKGLEFDIVFPDENVKVIYDAKWTLEAICNIVDNAIKYTETGSVAIEVIAYEIFCCIKITDTGIGISEEEQAQIFRRFYRSPQAAGTEGVGIGLYLAREIIAKEGGYIKLSSMLGKGAAFSVFLPIYSTSSTSIPSETSAVVKSTPI